VSDESLELLGLILGCIGKSRGKEERLFWTDGLYCHVYKSRVPKILKTR
jgi:hypothetical protein